MYLNLSEQFDLCSTIHPPNLSLVIILLAEEPPATRAEYGHLAEDQSVKLSVLPTLGFEVLSITNSWKCGLAVTV